MWDGMVDRVSSKQVRHRGKWASGGETSLLWPAHVPLRTEEQERKDASRLNSRGCVQSLCNHSCSDPTTTQVDQQVGRESVLTAAGQSLSAALSPISQPHVACSMSQRPKPSLCSWNSWFMSGTGHLCSVAGMQGIPKTPRHAPTPSACPLHTQTSSAGASPQQTTAHRCSHCRAIEAECSECQRRKNKSVLFLSIGNSVFLRCHSSFALCTVLCAVLSIFPTATAQNSGFPKVVFLLSFFFN